MLEVVFSDSACGSLKVAQHYGQGRCPSGCTGIILGNQKATEEEIAQARRRAEERRRREWENARPLGGDPRDVYSLSLGLSMGDISESVPGPARREALRGLFGFSSAASEVEKRVDRFMEKADRALTEILRRSDAGESVRIWYSDQPEELCGFYWALERLDSLGDRRGPVSMIKLPQFGQRSDGTVVQWNGWGNVSPGEWGQFLPLEQPVSPVLLRSGAAHWQKLRKENAPLRAVLNGKLVSAPETLYDSFIRQELALAEEEFQEAHLIGKVLSRFQLGIGDGQIASRIDAMIARGELEAVTRAPEDGPGYRRILRKRLWEDR